MDYTDYYKELGVAKTAAPDEIKRAYRKLAAKFHPDVNPGNKKAEERFKKINEAYEVVGNADNRKKYDEMGANWKQYEQIQQARRHQQQANTQSPFGQNTPPGFRYGQQNGPQPGPEEGEEGFGFSDFFRTFFNNRGEGEASSRTGSDLRATLALTLEEAYQGGPRMVQLGSQTLKLNLKPGLADGQKLRLKGKGGASPTGGPSGDLYLTIQVEPHPRLERRGDDLYLDVPLDLYTALLGGELQVEALTGTVKVPVAPETSNDTTLRLRGKGMPIYGKEDAFGALYLRLKVVLPKGLSPKEKLLFAELAEQRKVTA